MDAIKEKTRRLGKRTGYLTETTSGRAMLSINKITQPTPQVKTLGGVRDTRSPY